MGVIYLRTNTINGKQYVGQTTNFNGRERCWNSINRKTPYSNDILEMDRKKYGIEAFKTEILEECDDSKLNEIERFWIKQLNTIHPNGYNLENGGSDGFTFHQITREKMSKAKIGTKHSEEWKKNMSERMKGEGNHFYGKHHNQEAIEKIKAANIGRTSWNKGKKMSEEQRQKNIEASKKRQKHVYQYYLDGKLKAIYNGRNEAARITGFKKASIGNCCNGKLKTYKGYKWSYVPL